MEYVLGIAGGVMVIAGTVACLSQYTGAPPPFRNQFLVLVCGVVLMTVALSVDLLRDPLPHPGVEADTATILPEGV